MTSMQKMIERINARLDTLEREARDRQGWLTRLMLAGPRPEETEEVRADAKASAEPAERGSHEANICKKRHRRPLRYGTQGNLPTACT